MVTVDKAIIAKVEKGGKRFEVLVDPALAYELRSGKTVSLQRMLATNQVFHDAKKGDRAGPADLQSAFGTTDVFAICEKIVKEGEVQLTTEFRRRKVDEKKRQVAALIAEKAVDPRTKAPHPLERILNAMEQARVNVDAFLPAEQQAEAAIKAIKAILPLSVEEAELVVSIDAKYSSRAYGILRSFGSFSEQWSGSMLVAKVKIPAALKERFYSQLAKATDGTVKVEERR